jgi:DNA-binding IclR family transcriptional regulator
VVYIDKIDSTRPIRSWNPIGGHAPLHAAGTGKAILAAGYDRLRDRVSGRLERFTAHTITDTASLDADVAATRARGYAVDAGEYRDQVHSFGAAIVLPDGQAVAAIGVSVPTVNLPPDGGTGIGAALRLAAAEVSAALARF